MYLKELRLIWEMQCCCYSKLVPLTMGRRSVLFIVLNTVYGHVYACLQLLGTSIEGCLHVLVGV